MNCFNGQRKLRRWKRGQVFRAKHINEPVDAINRQISAPVNRDVSPNAGIPDGTLPGISVQKFKVSAIRRDYLLCHKYNGVTLGDAAYLIALPEPLQYTPFADKTVDGVAYVYPTAKDYTTRTENGTSKSITPAYASGDVIYAMNNVIGGTGVTVGVRSLIWQDMNSIGRSFEAAGAVATPFGLSISATDSTKVVIGVDRATDNLDDHITIGNDILAKTTAETVTITARSYVYYEITKTGATITATPGKSAAWPTQVDGKWFAVLGKAIYSGGAITAIHQYQFGQIELPARVA